MELIETIFTAVFFLIIGIPAGLIGLFTVFGVLYALPSVLLVIGAHIANKYHKTKMGFVLALTAALGQWLSFISWIVSRHAIDASEATRQWALDLPSIAKAGFPISALELPAGAMGSDRVPMDMWSGVFTNHLFWFAIALIVAVFITVFAKKFSSRNIMPVCIVLTSLALIYNLALFALWYD